MSPDNTRDPEGSLDPLRGDSVQGASSKIVKYHRQVFFIAVLRALKVPGADARSAITHLSRVGTLKP